MSTERDSKRSHHRSGHASSRSSSSGESSERRRSSRSASSAQIAASGRLSASRSVKHAVNTESSGVESIPSSLQPEASRKRRHRSSHGSHRHHHQSHSIWLQAFDFFLLVALMVPFVLGGRLACGELTLVLAAIGCALSWGFYQLAGRDEPVCIWTKAELCLLAVISVGLIQIVPLSPSMIDMISPKIAQILPLWDGAEAGLFERWNYISLSVGETRHALVLTLSYVMIFWLTAQRLRHFEDVQRLLRGICISAAVMAVFGLLQFLTSNGKFFWFFEFPAGTTADRVKGAFPNKNHFAAYLTLALGPYIWWLMDLIERPDEDEDIAFGTGQAAPLPKSVRVTLAALGGAAIAVGLLSSMSRGAVVSGAVGVTVMLLVLTIKGLVSKRLIGGLAALGLAAACLQLAIGYEKMVNRLDRWDDNGRLPIWKANIETTQDFPILGTGVGSHRHIHLRYIDKPYEEAEYTYAESNYLQVASETGLVGLSVAVLCLGVCLYWCCQAARLTQEKKYVVVQMGLLCSLIASMVGSIADFTWYIPGYTVILVLEMACACRVYQMVRETTDPTLKSSRAVPRLTLASAFMVMIATSVWMMRTLWPAVAAEPYWLHYRRLAFDAEEAQRIAAEQAEEGETHSNLRLLDVLAMKLKALRAGARANPDDSRFQLRLMRHYLLAFHELQKDSENAMPLSQIRDAAIAGEFESREAMREWLGRAFGDQVKYADAAYRHGVRAVRLNPIQFAAYLDLAELAFLGGANDEFHQRCVDQALLLAPNEAQVLYVAGREAFLRQDLETALTSWKRAFHRNRGVQFEIMRIIASAGLEQEGATQVDLIVKLFDPDIEALDRLAFIQQAVGLQTECHRTVELLAQKLEERANSEDTLTRAKDWVKAAGAFARIDQPEQVERCYKDALEVSPSNYLAHYEFGMWLYLQRRGADAREHLIWCAATNPRDLNVNKVLERLSRGIYPDPLPLGVSPTDALAQMPEVPDEPAPPRTAPGLPIERPGPLLPNQTPSSTPLQNASFSSDVAPSASGANAVFLNRHNETTPPPLNDPFNRRP